MILLNQARNESDSNQLFWSGNKNYLKNKISSYAFNLSEMNNFYTQCRPLDGIRHISTLLDSVDFTATDKFLLQAAKIIALVRYQLRFLYKFFSFIIFQYFADGRKDMADLSKSLVVRLREEALHLHNTMHKATINLLLDACENKWDQMNLLATILERAECFHLMAAIALNTRQFDVFKLVS